MLTQSLSRLPLALLAALFMAMCGALVGADKSTTDPASTAAKEDVEFVTKAASGGLFEVRSSEVAMSRPLGEDTKKFAKMMIDDHTSSNHDLDQLAAKKNIVVPATLITKHQKMLDELGEANDKKFEATYLEYQVKAHKEAVSLFEEASKDAKDPDLRAFAVRVLPTLREHLDRAKALEKAH